MISNTYTVTEPLLQRILSFIARSQSLPQGWLVSDVFQLIQEINALPPAVAQSVEQAMQEGK